MTTRLLFLLGLLLARPSYATDCSAFPGTCDPSATCHTLSPSGLVTCDPCYCPWDTDSYIPNLTTLNNAWGRNLGYGCVTIPMAASTAISDLYFWAAPATNTTLVDIGCHCQGTCTGPIAAVSFETAAGAAISTASTLTCSTGSTALTYVAFDTTDADRVLAKGAGLRTDLTAPTTADTTTVCFHYSF